MDVFHIFGRLFAIVFGYCLACVAASYFLAFTVPGWAPDVWFADRWHAGFDVFFYEFDTSGEAAGAADFVGRIVLGAFGASVIGGLAFVPAGLAILAAETLRLRSILYHLLAGGLIALALVAATWIPEAGPVSMPPDWNLFLAAGFVGGFVYWLIAGRGSGIVKPETADPRA